MQIRKYQKHDFPALCEIHDPARKQELKSAKLSAAFIPFKTAAIKENLFDDYQVYIAQKDKQVVGFVAFNDEELGWLYVKSKYQHQGIGSQLIDFAIKNAGRPFYLEVLEGNPAQKLYLAKGFKIIQHESGKMPGNESFHVEVNLMKFE